MTENPYATSSNTNATVLPLRIFYLRQEPAALVAFALPLLSVPCSFLFSYALDVCEVSTEHLRASLVGFIPLLIATIISLRQWLSGLRVVPALAMTFWMWPLGYAGLKSLQYQDSNAISALSMFNVAVIGGVIVCDLTTWLANRVVGALIGIFVVAMFAAVGFVFLGLLS